MEFFITLYIIKINGRFENIMLPNKLLDFDLVNLCILKDG